MTEHIFDHREVVARKRHVCESCGRPIRAGERHSVTPQIVDGKFWNYREHADCHAACLIVWQELTYPDNEKWPQIDDFVKEDREHVEAVDADLAARLWPEDDPPWAKDMDG